MNGIGEIRLVDVIFIEFKIRTDEISNVWSNGVIDQIFQFETLRR